MFVTTVVELIGAVSDVPIVFVDTSGAIIARYEHKRDVPCEYLQRHFVAYDYLGGDVVTAVAITLDEE